MRNKRLSENWALMLPDLSKAYLERQQRPQGTTSPDTSSGPSEGAAVISTAAPSEYDCELDTIDVFNLSTFITLGGRTEDSPSLAEEMVSEGYIVNAPFSPSVAVSIETLELYRWIAHRHPTFTLQTFARITSCLYNVSAVNGCLRNDLLTRALCAFFRSPSSLGNAPLSQLHTAHTS